MTATVSLPVQGERWEHAKEKWGVRVLSCYLWGGHYVVLYRRISPAQGRRDVKAAFSSLESFAKRFKVST